MKNLIIFLGISFLLISSCVSKKTYDLVRRQYADTLGSLRKDLKAEIRDKEKMIEISILLRKQAESQKTKIKTLEDSLEELDQIILSFRYDSTAAYKIWKDNQKLRAGLQNARKQIENLQKDKAYLNQIKQRTQQQIKRLEDSLGVLNKVLKQSYTSPFNYTKQLRLFKNTFDCYVVNLEKSKLRFFWKNKAGQTYKSFNSLLSDLHKTNETLIFATNGGMYTPRHAPQGLYIENGKTLRPIDLGKTGKGNFYMMPNGVFLIDESGRAQVLPSDGFGQVKNKIWYATQSGPMLLIDGKIHNYFTPGSQNKYIRSGVGVISPNQIVFVISRKPVNFYDFARIFRDNFKCKNALYLDGAISKMFLPEIGRYDLGGEFGPMIGIIK